LAEVVAMSGQALLLGGFVDIRGCFASRV